MQYRPSPFISLIEGFDYELKDVKDKLVTVLGGISIIVRVDVVP